MNPRLAPARFFAGLAFALAPWVLVQPAAAQTYVSLTNTNANSYTQNFDSLGTATISNAISATTGVQTALGSAVNAGLNGWHAAKIGGTGAAATSITANNGSFTSGGVANYGSTNVPANIDRSLGGLSSGSTIPGFGALIVNETGQTLTGVQISFTAKFWRSSTTTQNVLTFGYGVVDSATVTTNNFITAAGASALPAANIVGPAPVTSNGPLDGNNPANQSAVSSLTIPQALAPGAVMYIRWQDANEAGNDAGLAVDDLSLTALAGAPPATAPFVAPVTVPPIGVTRTQAGANSDVTGDGGSPITGRGFVYSVSSVNPSPTLGGTGVFNTPDALAQVGPMTGTLTGLSPSTTYAVRSYASNAVGTTYSAVTTFTTPDAPIAFTGSYGQSFATYTGTVPTGWTAISSSNSSAYGGDWGTGSTGGFRGVGATTGNVLGYQHTSSTGILSVSVSFVNSTGALLDALNISYLGRTALPANTRTPEWIVSLNGTAVASLAYSTGNTDGAAGAPADLTKSAQLTGLGIAPGAEFTISWVSERGTGTGNSRQIGLADFSIVAVDPTAPIINVNPSTISTLVAVADQSGTAQAFQVSGSNLTGDLTVTAPANFEVSTTSATSGFGGTAAITASGTLAATDVWVRIAQGVAQGAVGPANVQVSGGGATNRSVAVSGTVTNPASPAINVSTSSLSGFVTLRGTASTNQTVTVTGTNMGGTNITVASSNNFYEISTDSFTTPGSNSLSLASTGGLVAVRISTNAPATNNLVGNLALSGAGATNNVALSGAVTNLSAVITVSTNSLTGFSTTVGAASPAQNFSITASNLTANVVISPPAGFAISTNATAFSAAPITIPSGQFVSPTTVSVRLTGASQGSPSGNVSVASTGAAAQNVAVSGTVSPAPSFLLTLAGTLTNFTTPQGVPSTPQSLVVQGSGLTNNVTVFASDNLQFTTNTNSSASYVASLVLPINGGALSNTVFARIPDTAAAGGPTTNTITASSGATNATLNAVTTVSSNTSPFIVANPTSLSGFSTTEGTPSTNLQTFTAGGTNLTGNLNIAAPSGYEISTNGTSFSSLISLAPTGGTPVVTNLAVDDANNYTSATWTNGANGGTGFGAWTIASTNGTGGFGGVFIGTPTAAGITTNATFGTNAFGMYANPGTSGAFADVDRTFATLQDGQTFSFQWAINWDSDVGNKGFSLYSGGTSGTQILNVNQGGFPGDIRFIGGGVTNNNIGLAFGTGPMTWSFAMTSPNNLLVTSSPRDGTTGVAFSTNIAVAAGPDSFRWYVSAMSAGDQRQQYYNNLKIVGTTASGNVSPTTIYVRLSGAAAGSAVGNIDLTSLGAPPKAVALSGTVLPRPVITPTATLTPFAADLGTSSAAQSFTFVGTNLVGDVTLTAPAGYEIAKTTNGTYASSLTYALAEAQPGPATNWVRLAATAPPGIVAGNIALASQGAVTTNVPVTGRVTGDPVISVLPSALTNFFAPLGAPSDAQSFIARGVDLDGDIILNASNATSWEIRDPADGVYKSTVTLVASNAVPVAFARDSATNAAYSGGWTNGSDGGTGFGAWAISVDPGSDATATIGNPADAGITGMNNTSFALQGTNGYVTVQRRFDGPLLPGDTFSLQFGNNFDAGSAGNKGLNIYAGGFDQANQLININMGESATITINGQPMFTQYGTAAVALNFQYVAPGQLRVFGTGRNGTETFDQTFAVPASPDGFSLYAGNLAVDQVAQRVLYANNFAITTGSVGPSVSPTEILVRIKGTAPENNALTGSVTAVSPNAAPVALVYNAHNDFYLSPTAGGWGGATSPSVTGAAWGYYAANVNGFGFPNQIGTYFTPTAAGGGSQNLYQYSSVAPIGSGTVVGTSLWAATGGAGFPNYQDNIPWGTSLGRYDTPWFSGAPGFSQGLSNFIWMQSGWLGGGSSEGIAPVLTWTAPANASFTFTGRFVAGDQPANSAAVAIVDSLGGTSLSRTVLANNSSQAFNFTKTYNAGDVVQFQVGNNFSIGNAVGLQLQVRAAAATVPAVVTLSGIVSKDPEIIQTSAFVPFLAVQGFPSDPQTFTVGGNNLEAGVLVTPPPGYEVSLDGIAWSPTVTVPRTGIITPQQTVYIRIASTTPVGTPGGNILLTSTNAPNVTIPITGTVEADTGPQLSANPTLLPLFTTDEGTPSAPGSFTLTARVLNEDLVISAPEGFELAVSINGVLTSFAPSQTITPSMSGLYVLGVQVRLTGAAIGLYSGDVTAVCGTAEARVKVSGAVFDPAFPKDIVVEPDTLTGFQAIEGFPSASQSFQAAGRGLTASNAVVAAPSDYEVSLDDAAFSAQVQIPVTGGAFPPTTVYVRLGATAAAGTIIDSIDLFDGAPSPASYVNTVVVEGTVASINVDPASLTGFVTPARVPSAAQSFVFSAGGLGNTPVVLTTSGGFEISRSAAGPYATSLTVDGVGGTIGSTRIFVRLAALFSPVVTAPLPVLGDVTLSVGSGGLVLPCDGVINPNLVVEQFRPPAANGPVRALADDGSGRLYIGGSFSRLVRSGVTNAAPGLARLQIPSGALDTSFAVASGGDIRALAYVPTNIASTNVWIYAAGRFTNDDGSVSLLRRYSTNGVLDTGFAPDLLGTNSSPSAQALALAMQPNGRLIVGGSFAGGIRRIGANGLVQPPGTFRAGANGIVNAVRLQPDGKIIVGGGFTSVTEYDPTTSNNVPVPRERIARFLVSGAVDTAFGTAAAFNGPVNSVVSSANGTVFAGGAFSSFGGRRFYNNLAAVDTNGILLGAFNYEPGLAGPVQALALDATGRLLSAGSFTNAGNASLGQSAIPVGRVAAMNAGDGLIDVSFNGGGAGANDTVFAALALPGGRIAMGGAFTSFNGDTNLSRVVLLNSEPVAAGYPSWADRWFADPKGAAAAPATKNNALGLANIAVYALSGGSPWNPSAHQVPASVVGQRSGSLFLTLRAGKNLGANGEVSYIPEWSSDLRTWATNAGKFNILTNTPSELIFESTEPVGTRPQFLRLRFSLP